MTISIEQRRSRNRVAVNRYAAAHRDEKNAYAVIYRAAHRDAIRRWENNWPWRVAYRAVECARRSALKFGLDPGLLTKEVFARLHLLPCAYCGAMPSMGADHVIPLVRGGANTLENLVPACLPCNKRKRSMTTEEFAP